MIVILEEEDILIITLVLEEGMEVSLIEVGMVEGEGEGKEVVVGMVDQPIIIKESLTMEVVLVAELVDLCVSSVKRQDIGPRIAHRRNTEGFGKGKKIEHRNVKPSSVKKNVDLATVLVLAMCYIQLNIYLILYIRYNLIAFSTYLYKSLPVALENTKEASSL